MQPLRLCIFLAFIAVLGCYGFSDSTLNCVAIVNGNYDNSMQYQQGVTKHALITLRVVPVDIPFLRPAIVWYVEWAADGKVLHMQIGVVTEGPEDNIYVTLSNFTDPSLYTPGQFNVSSVSDLKPEDLRGNNCTAVFKALAPAVFAGYWPDCRTVVRKDIAVNISIFQLIVDFLARLRSVVCHCFLCCRLTYPHHPDYANTIMCEEISIVLPPTVEETFSPVPYVFRRQGPRYPLYGIPDTYDSVCGKTA